ncbi:MAG: arabinosyltransferase domain-containing protein, partial [Nocardioides sp.]|uniref:arabinosyltransferase domain-containing protein n=1 Tax=Nocardioides sp. TaxID=35761 RepID=UPI003264329D
EERSRRPGWVFVGLLTAGLALTTHQTGWVAAAPAAVIMWSIPGELRRDRSSGLALVSAVCAAAAGLVLVAFAAADVGTVLEGVSNLGEVAHNLGPLDEVVRYNRLLDASGARFSTVLILLLWCLAGSLGINTARPESRRLWILCLLWLGGLLLTATKWEWHLAVYAVPAVALASLAGVDLRRPDGVKVLGTSAVLAIGVLAAGIGLSIMGAWNRLDLSHHSWQEFTTLLLGDSGRIYWYVGLVALIALGLLADHRRGRWQPAAVTALCVTILFPLGASMVWLVADAAEPGWSSTGANLRQLTDNSACGVLDGLDIDTDVVALPQQQDSGETQQLAPGAFPQIERLSTGPLGGEVPTWGTWVAIKQSSPDALTGSFRSPSYEIGDAEAITLWAASGTTDLLQAEVVFTSSSGTETTSPVLPGSDPRWSILRLTVPDGATEVRVDVEDQNSGYGGWLAVSSPVVSSDSSISSTLDGSTGYANPLEATLVPCLELPDTSEGYWGRVDYVFSEAFTFSLDSFRNLTVTEVACRPDVICLRKLDYPMADVVVTRTG